MKMLISILASTLLTFCSSGPKQNVEPYQNVTSLWQEKANIQKIIKTFGQPDTINASDVTYFFPDSKTPRLYFKINSSEKIVSALMFLDAKKIESFKTFVGCPWQEKRDHLTIKDNITLNHHGECQDRPIKFSYFSSLNSYEIWWNANK